MSLIKIKYYKICRRHKQVEKAKRMLVKAYKTVENYDTYYKIQLTGISELDYREVNVWFKREFQNYSKLLADDIKNDEEYNEGFYFSKYEKFLALCRQLYDTMRFIDSEYPLIETKTAEYCFVSADVEEMYREANIFCSQISKNALQKVFYAVYADSSERELFPYTFEKNNLKGVKKLIIKYK